MTAAQHTSGAPHDALLGAELLGRYRVRRKLGEGGMGAVYEAENVLLQRRVAIKFLLPQLATDAEVVARFVREAQAATRIEHPHIVEILDLDALPDGSRFMVLELLDGRDLEAVLTEQGKLPLGRTLDIALQVCDALAAAHRAGVVHRDLKPANVFLVRRGDREDFVKLVDFGIARLQEAAGFQAHLTRTGAVLGTPCYMAPEQVMGRRELDQRVDVYALGVMLLECLTGRLPFEGATFGELVVQISRQPPPALTALAPEHPRDLGDLIDRMLAKEPADRPGSCDEVAAALTVIAQRSTGSGRRRLSDGGAIPAHLIAHTPPARPAPESLASGLAPARGRASARWPLLAGTSGLVVLLVVAGALVWRFSGPAPGASSRSAGVAPSPSPSRAPVPAEPFERLTGPVGPPPARVAQAAVEPPAALVTEPAAADAGAPGAGSPATPPPPPRGRRPVRATGAARGEAPVGGRQAPARAPGRGLITSFE